MQSYLQNLTPTYYDTLVQWDLVEELMNLLDEAEQMEAYQILFQTLDHVVLEKILETLDQRYHAEFLELLTHQHHEPFVLSWLEERSAGISQVIRVTIQQTKLEIKQLLIQEPSV